MEIEINRIALYLSGKLPPYYKPYHKYAFIENLEANSDGTFTETVFDRITKYITTDEGFYSECLLRLQKYNDTLFLSFLDILEVPLDARGKIVPWTQEKSEIKKEFEKTIGFITPFDSAKEYLALKGFIRNTLDELWFNDWKIEESSFDVWWETQTLWGSVEEFLNKYPLYIANFRDQNLNVALEVGYLQGKWINFIQIKNEWEKVSDLDGFIYVSSRDTKSKPWTPLESAAWSHEKNQDNFKEKLIVQLKRYIK